MGRINVLPSSVAELIAAGEVVDRPAAIVKELVENALDAGADRVSVEIKNGGVGYIRVSDNGSGIASEDMPTAFVRHATSKIAKAADLDSIATLGFRGEALPSIAAVSRVKVTSRTADERLGSCFFIDGSGRTEQTECGCAVGTVVEVKDLFYNTPARMKFLKKDVTEGNAVASLLDRLALANPSVAFDFIRDGKKTLSTAGDGKLLSAVRMVCGADIAAGMLPVSYSRGGISINGLISRPTVSRTTRSLQTFFVNSRYVRSKTCAAAVEEAYKNRMMTGRFPACVINMEIDCSLVDVNVHPAKLEVRFSDERTVYNTVYSACMEALSDSERRQPAQKSRINPFALSDFDYSDRQTTLTGKTAVKYDAPKSITAMLAERGETGAARRPVMQLRDDSKMTYHVTPPQEDTAPPRTVSPAVRRAIDIECDETVNERLSIKPADAALTEAPEAAETAKPAEVKTHAEKAVETPDAQDSPAAALEAAATITETEPVTESPDLPYRIIGELFDTYILVQRSDSFIMIDKHAAHERYIYERIKDWKRHGERQILLTPQPVSLAREEYFALSEHPEALLSLGIDAEDFGEGIILVREIPMLLDGFSLPELLGEVARRIMSKRNSVTPELLDELLYSVSCRAAVMAGKRSALPEMEAVADMVLGSEAIRHCPHGRPVMVALSRREVEKLFGRIG